jgi:hypothetical protein
MGGLEIDIGQLMDGESGPWNSVLEATAEQRKMRPETITRVFAKSPTLVFFSKQRNINAVLTTLT